MIRRPMFTALAVVALMSSVEASHPVGSRAVAATRSTVRAAGRVATRIVTSPRRAVSRLVHGR